MLNYKKKANIKDTIIQNNGHRLAQQLKMSDISKIERITSDNENNKLKIDNINLSNIKTTTHDKSFNSRIIDPQHHISQMSNNPPQLISSSINPNLRYKSDSCVEKSNYVINIQQTVDKDSIIVETVYSQKKFMFYDRNKNFLGGFDVYEFIKYITSNVSSSFLLGIDCDSVRPIIEKYICNVKYVEKPSKRYVINMLNYFESPFMGNIETLIKFYSFVHEFENEKLKHELDKLESIDAIKTLKIFNNMIYTLLNHILKIIAALTNKISPNDNPKIKDSLLNYSVAIVYRLSKFIRTEIDDKVDELNNLDLDILRIENIRTCLSVKLDSVQRSLDKQSTEIDVILRNLIMYQMMNNNNAQLGGSNNVPDKKSNEKISSANNVLTSNMSSSELSNITSTIDTSQIYDFDSNTINVAPAIQTQKSEKTFHSDQMALSDLLREVNKLKSISDKKSAAEQKLMHMSNTPIQSTNSANSATNLSDGVAKSLSDILSIHNKINFSTDSDNSFQSEINKTNAEFNYLSSSNNTGSTSIDNIFTIE